MTAIRGSELAAWAVFVAGVITMLVRGAFLRSTVQKHRTGWILTLAMLLTGLVSAVVHTLSGLGVAAFFGDGGRRALG